MIRLQEEPLDLGALCAAVGDPEHGAIATFLGTTRREAGCDEIEALDYEVYEELAMAEMRAIADEARGRFGARVAIVHRLGRVAVGEASVGVDA
jgi:molybdopterin synthase catalytic subunit